MIRNSYTPERAMDTLLILNDLKTTPIHLRQCGLHDFVRGGDCDGVLVVFFFS